jgi:RNA-binding protein 26
MLHGWLGYRTEADPTLLADYVAALLKNDKSKKELQKLCIDQLYDFLGEGKSLQLENSYYVVVFC